MLRPDSDICSLLRPFSNPQDDDDAGVVCVLGHGRRSRHHCLGQQGMQRPGSGDRFIKVPVSTTDRDKNCAKSSPINISIFHLQVFSLHSQLPRTLVKAQRVEGAHRFGNERQDVLLLLLLLPLLLPNEFGCCIADRRPPRPFAQRHRRHRHRLKRHRSRTLQVGEELPIATEVLRRYEVHTLVQGRNSPNLSLDIFILFKLKTESENSKTLKLKSLIAEPTNESLISGLGN
jgi:hypothetical protein